MEQATNSFNKGIQLDTHPMVQGNDTLSDCVNGTLITMNGNEVILQNDMGNRRVDNAFLPSGYEPVGIKEYGGIIYIASYNPITNKSQIGSFPSPERNIGNENDNESPIKNKGLKDYFEYEEYENKYFLKNDSKLIPLTNDMSLHAGDKFVVYTDHNGFGDEQSKITNFDNININSKKVHSPKNKLYTLQLGVLNSQNQFVDITNTLCRWDNIGNKIEFDKNESSLFQFNKGYFIPTVNNSNSFKIDTINDETLNTERTLQLIQTQNCNTYSYKLVGPLYLKITLNHVQDFSYDIYGVYNRTTNKIELDITGTFIYNCPDGVSQQINNGGDDDYYTYDTGIVSKNFGFDFISSNISNNNKTEDDVSLESTYDKSQNLYKVTIIKHIEGTFNGNNNILTYDILVKTNSDSNSNEENKKYYLKGLSQSGILDLDKLGSGEIKLLGWRYLNNYKEGKSTITYNLEAYPKYGQSFQNLRIYFREISGSNVPNTNNIVLNAPSLIIDDFELLTPLQGTINNGRNSITFNLEDIGLEKQKMYSVVFKCDIIGTSETRELTNNNYWFLSTELFNDCYNENSNNFVRYFNEFSTTYNHILTQKLKIPIGIKANSELVLSELKREITGGGLYNYDSPENSNISFGVKHTQDFEIKVYPEFYIKNQELYPKNIKINKTANINNNITFGDLISNAGNISDNIVIVKNGDDISFNNSDKPKVTIEFNNSNDKHISGQIKFTDNFYAKTTSKQITITNVFKKAQKVIEELYEGNNFKYRADIFPDSQNDDLHFLRGVIFDPSIALSGSNQNNPRRIFGHASNHPNQVFIYKFEEEEKDSLKLYRLSDAMESISSFFNSYIINSKDIFLWAFSSDGNTLYQRSNRHIDSNDALAVGSENNGYSVLWWKGKNGIWIPGNQLIKLGTNISISQSVPETSIKDTIKNMFNKNIVICFNKSYFQQINMADRTKCTYNQFYSGTIDLKIDINPKDIDDIIENNYFEETEITFTTNSSSDTIEKSINISSSEDFQNNIIKALNPEEISNIYLEKGIQKDSEGNNLYPNRVYRLINNETELEWIKNSSIFIDGTSDDSYYIPLCNYENVGTFHNPQARAYIGADEVTILNYEGVKGFPMSNESII